jgi:hypothetical protein
MMNVNENDGLNEIFEHTLQVGTGILTEHARGAVEQRAAVARAQTSALQGNTTIGNQQLAAVEKTLVGDLADVVKVASLGSALPVADAVAQPPGRAPQARRARGNAQPTMEREQGR